MGRVFGPKKEAPLKEWRGTKSTPIPPFTSYINQKISTKSNYLTFVAWQIATPSPEPTTTTHIVITTTTTNNIKTTFNCTNYLLFENKNRPPAKVKSKNARQLPRVQDFLGCSTIHWWRGGDNSGSVSGVLLCGNTTEVSYMHCIFFRPNHSVVFQY